MGMLLSRSGQALGAGDANAKFLKVYGGEVLASFLEANKLMALTRTKTITSGESAVFPVVGTATASYHTAGESIITDSEAGGDDYLSNIKSTDVRIYIDDILQSSHLVYDLDEMKSHWETRSHYSRAQGHSLAKKADAALISTIYAASLAANTITTATSATEGRTSSTYATCTAGADLFAFAFEAAAVLDGLNVPEYGRCLLVRPSQYYALVQYLNLISSDYTAGANGGVDAGRVYQVAGFRIVASNNFGNADSSAVAATGERNDPLGAAGIAYNADLVNVGALAFQTECVGTVKMKDLSVETDRITERLSDLVVASYAMGHGILRPECAVNMVSTAAAPAR